MKKFGIVLLVLFSAVLAQNIDSFDFRKTTWGMSKEQVKITEKKDIEWDTTLENGLGMLAYKDNVSGFDCFIYYIFVENQLVRATYYFRQEHSNKNGYIDDYYKLKGIVMEKYGKPIEDKQNWLDDLYKDDYQEWGFAVSLGHLVYYSKWKTANTNICLVLKGENYNIELELEYASIKLEELMNKAKNKENLNKF